MPIIAKMLHWLRTLLTPKVEPVATAPIAAPIAKPGRPLLDGRPVRICVDAGHGGKDPGAVGPKGTHEATLALAMALLLTEHLAKLGIDVTLTRAQDLFVGLDARTDAAKKEKVDAFISIHCNSATIPTAEGVETLFNSADPKSKAMANTVHQALMAFSVGHKDRGIKGSPSTEIPRRLHVLAVEDWRAILVETEFVSHPTQEQWLGRSDVQDGIAFALAKGTHQWIKSLPNYTEESVAPAVA